MPCLARLGLASDVSCKDGDCQESGRSLGGVTLVLRSDPRGGCAVPTPVTPALR